MIGIWWREKHDPFSPPLPLHRRRKTTEGTISISGYIRGVGRKYKGNGEGRGGGLWRFTTQTATRINIQAGASTD